jgi:hypothetical protein
MRPEALIFLCVLCIAVALSAALVIVTLGQTL